MHPSNRLLRRGSAMMIICYKTYDYITSELKRAFLVFADLTEAILQEANLDGAILTEANLTKADLD